MPTRTWMADPPEGAALGPLVEPSADRPGWRRPDRVFPALLLLFGSFFAVGVPPTQVPDEWAHYVRSCSLAQGHLGPTQVVNGWGADEIPASSLRVSTHFGRLPGQLHEKMTWDDVAALRATSAGDDEPKVAVFAGAVMNSFVSYAPSAVGVALARLVGLDPLLTFYAGRLSALFIAALLVHLAIRVAPISKCAFGAVALIPIAVQQMASYSPDSPVIALAMLLTATILRVALSPSAATPQALAAVAALSVWTTFSKVPYAGVAVFFAAVPTAKLGTPRRYALAALVLAALVGGSVVGSARASRGFAPEVRRHGPGKEGIRSINYQMTFLKKHPIHFAKACYKACVEYGGAWIAHLSVIGHLDTVVHQLPSQVYMIFLVVVVMLDQPLGVRLSARMRIAAAAGFVAAFGLMLTAQYTWHTPIANRIVEGIQGRYFVPILPLLAVALNAPWFGVRADPRKMLAFAASGSVAMLVVSCCTLVQRYYLADPARLMATTNLVGFGLAAGLATSLVVGRADRPRASAPQPEDA